MRSYKHVAYVTHSLYITHINTIYMYIHTHIKYPVSNREKAPWNDVISNAGKKHVLQLVNRSVG